VLALTGDLDTITPTADAARIVSRFPRGHLLVAEGIGHSVVTSRSAGCAGSAVRAWLSGHPIPERCTRLKLPLAPLAAISDDLTQRPPRVASPRETLAIAARTLREAEATWWIAAAQDRHEAVGLRGGTLTRVSGQLVKLSGYRLERGLTVTGELFVTTSGNRPRFSGVLSVSGSGAAHGRLVVVGDKVAGVLGGQVVGNVDAVAENLDTSLLRFGAWTR
jgi:hypothetical protein